MAAMNSASAPLAASFSTSPIRERISWSERFALSVTGELLACRTFPCLYPVYRGNSRMPLLMMLQKNKIAAGKVPAAISFLMYSCSVNA